jgi:hypothetical protein
MAGGGGRRNISAHRRLPAGRASVVASAAAPSGPGAAAAALVRRRPARHPHLVAGLHVVRQRQRRVLRDHQVHHLLGALSSKGGHTRVQLPQQDACKAASRGAGGAADGIRPRLETPSDRAG